MSGSYSVSLTESQRMALLDVLMQALQCGNKEAHSERFIDHSQEPAIVTTVGQLLKAVSDAEWKDKHDRETG